MQDNMRSAIVQALAIAPEAILQTAELDNAQSVLAVD